MLRCSPWLSLLPEDGPEARGGSLWRDVGAADADGIVDVEGPRDAAVGGRHEPIPALSDRSLGTCADSWLDAVTSRDVASDDGAAASAGDEATAGRSLPNSRFDTSEKTPSSIL